jgi:hypothetical protein
MKIMFHIGLLLCLAATVAAQELPSQKTTRVLRVYDWRDSSAQFPNSQIISLDGISVLKVENTNDAPLEVLLLTITNSSLAQKVNTIEWEMKYENVCRSTNENLFIGYYFGARRELYETFPPQAVGGDNPTNYTSSYFVGTKNWDKYEFQITPAPYDNETRPNKLRLKLSLPSSGTIYLRPIKLLGVVGGSDSWWSPQQSGLIGGIGGSIIGCFGGLIGWLVSKGKARKFVLAATAIFIVLGILLTIAGLAAAILKQPYSVWYALLLPGVILVLVFSLNLHSIQRRYDELEIRRMTSIDVMGS